ncbi:peptidase family M48-domain-containing protein [Fimicolochytrium jonesii]|uniref:peptidase family M48-domain-containing protein n=1 Tax=Fimicolochytrium jonesii TaxID=1396493 RepID=UPI0022FE6B2B|nr:peptidase family M48-domain-containing protein [Fimicolochytrium jonesii]KAI8822201.1 peptidase family M48-domain-containing protein [Fimicolochytrium jonesii]
MTVQVNSGDLPYKHYVLVFSWFIYAWNTLLNYRQYLALHNPKIPASVSHVIKADEFNKARLYGLDKAKFAFLKDLVEQIESTVYIYYDVLPYVWNVAGTLMGKYGYGAEYEVVQSIVFVVLLSIIPSTSIPFSLYSTFVIEERHGFNKQTLRLFFTDMVKGQLLSAVIGIPLLVAFLKIIEWAGSNFYFYIWVFVLVVQFVMILIFPTLIQPLFNKFTPLPEGTLRTKINELASRINFPLKKLFVIDGSKRSAHSNAYFYGFFKNKRIVLYDTLLDHSTEDEVCAVLAHELGHWHYNHVLSTLVIIQLHLFCIFYLFSLFINHTPLYRAFGFATEPVLIGFTLFQYLLGPVETVLGFLQNMVSRRNEFQADSFAKKLGYGTLLKSALTKLHVENKGTLNPDPWYSAWHYSHPPLVERLNAIGKTE